MAWRCRVDIAQVNGLLDGAECAVAQKGTGRREEAEEVGEVEEMRSQVREAMEVWSDDCNCNKRE